MLSSLRVLALDHLTMLDVAPPDLVTVAGSAGFDAVGLRVAPVTRTEQAWPMAPGSPMLALAARRCADSGVAVLDVEALLMGPAPDLAAFEPALESGAVLGARYVITICEDPDLGRFADHFAALVQMARPYQVRPVIEFMIFRHIRTLADAIAIARKSDGGGVVLDTLHIQRCGVTPAELASIDPALLGYAQLCDALAQLPDGSDAAAEARGGRLLPGEGEIPLAGILGAMPADLAVSVEAPNLAARGAYTPAQFAARAKQALDSVLS